MCGPATMSGFCRAIAASLAAVRHVSLMIPSETENWMQWEEVEEVEEVEGGEREGGGGELSR